MTRVDFEEASVLTREPPTPAARAGKCSKPCGGGLQTRTRGFSSGNPSPECFKMDTVETRLCNVEECPCAPPETPCVMFFDEGADDYSNFGECLAPWLGHARCAPWALGGVLRFIPLCLDWRRRRAAFPAAGFGLACAV